MPEREERRINDSIWSWGRMPHVVATRECCAGHSTRSKQQPNPQSGPAPCLGGGATTTTTGRPALVASRMHEQRAMTATWRAMLAGS